MSLASAQSSWVDYSSSAQNDTITDYLPTSLVILSQLTNNEVVELGTSATVLTGTFTAGTDVNTLWLLKYSGYLTPPVLTTGQTFSITFNTAISSTTVPSFTLNLVGPISTDKILISFLSDVVDVPTAGATITWGISWVYTGTGAPSNLTIESQSVLLLSEDST